MLKSTRRYFAVGTVLCLLLAVPTLGQLSPNKKAELNAAGITDWDAHRAELKAAGGPTFSRLERPLAAPGRADASRGGTTGTVMYDDGTITSLPTSFGAVYGNKFAARPDGTAFTGAVTLNSFSFFFMEDSLADTGMSIQVSDPLNATSITSRTSPNVTGLLNSGQSFSSPQINVRMQSTAFGTTGVFSNTVYLGGWCLNTNTTLPVNNEAIGLSNNMLPGAPPFRGFTTNSGTGANTFTDQSFNAIIRANLTGNNVPVELMSFSVDGN